MHHTGQDPSPHPQEPCCSQLSIPPPHCPQEQNQTRDTSRSPTTVQFSLFCCMSKAGTFPVQSLMHTNSSFYCYSLTVTAAKGQEAGSASQQGKQGRATALCLWGFTADRQHSSAYTAKETSSSQQPELGNIRRQKSFPRLNLFDQQNTICLSKKPGFCYMTQAAWVTHCVPSSLLPTPRSVSLTF